MCQDSSASGQIRDKPKHGFTQLRPVPTKARRNRHTGATAAVKIIDMLGEEVLVVKET